MKIIFYFLIIFLLPAIAKEDTTSVVNFSRVTIKSYEEEVYDDGIYRKRFVGFKLFKGDEQIVSVGESWDKLHELLLPTGEIKILVRNPKSRKIDSFVFNVTPNTIGFIDLEKGKKDNEIKQLYFE